MSRERFRRGDKKTFVVICRVCGETIEEMPAQRPPDANGNNFGHGTCDSCAKEELRKIKERQNIFSK
jgi:hypothetical protein